MGLSPSWTIRGPSLRGSRAAVAFGVCNNRKYHSTGRNCLAIGGTLNVDDIYQHSLQQSNNKLVRVYFCRSPTRADIHDPIKHTGIKIGAGVGVPLGLVLIGSIIYILYLRFQRHMKSPPNIFRGGEEISEAPPTVSNIPQMLAASPLQQQYDRPELSEATWRQYVELSAWHATELPISRLD